MDLYHAWCDLKPGVRDTEFSDRVAPILVICSSRA